MVLAGLARLFIVRRKKSNRKDCQKQENRGAGLVSFHVGDGKNSRNEALNLSRTEAYQKTPAL